MRPDHAAPRIRSRVVGATLAATAVAALGAVPAEAATVEVAAVNRAFVPASVTVQLTGNEPGFPAPHAHVVWTMGDAGTEHTVTFDDPRLVSSGRLGAGQRHEALIYAAGTYPYRCTIHQGMAGTVVVTGEPATTTPATATPATATAATTTAATITAGATSTPSPAAAGAAAAGEPAEGGPGAGVILGLGAAGTAVAGGLAWLLVRRRRAGADEAGG